jgi:hypothetical protein
MSSTSEKDIFWGKRNYPSKVSIKRHQRGRPLLLYKTQIVKRIQEYFLLNPNPTLVELAEFVGITQTTLEKYIKRFHFLREAIKQGGLPADIEVAASLRDRANGYAVTETKVVKKFVMIDGEQKEQIEEIVQTMRYIPPSVDAAKYWLSKRNKNWQDQNEVEKFEKDKELIAELLQVKEEDLPE